MNEDDDVVIKKSWVGVSNGSMEKAGARRSREERAARTGLGFRVLEFSYGSPLTGAVARYLTTRRWKKLGPVRLEPFLTGTYPGVAWPYKI